MSPPPRSALATHGSQDGHIWLKLRALNLSQKLKLVDHAPAKLQMVLQFIIQSSHSMNSGQLRGCWTLLHASGLHLRILPDIPWRRDTPPGWSLRGVSERILICARYLVSELGISLLRLKSQLSEMKDWLWTYNISFRHKPLTKCGSRHT